MKVELRYALSIFHRLDYNQDVIQVYDFDQKQEAILSEVNIFQVDINSIQHL